MVNLKELFDLKGILLEKYLAKYEAPYEVLPDIHTLILEIGNTLDENEYQKIKENIWIHKSVTLSNSIEIIGPCIIMENACIRHNAYLRENVIIGKNSVVGNSCEIKNSILLDYCEVPHFNYVGDSILGHHAHLGAGAIISNLRLDKENIMIDNTNTHLRKIGAFLGDNVQVGCNAVINPGTIIYPNTIIYPLTTVKGIIKENNQNNGIKVERL